MISPGGLIFSLLSLLMAWLLWSGREQANGRLDNRWRLRLRSAIPPLIIAACLPSGCANDRFDTLRMRVNGVSFTEADGGAPAPPSDPTCTTYPSPAGTVFIVGGERRCVDLVVRYDSRQQVDGPLVRVETVAGGAATLQLASLAANGNAMIAALDEGTTRTLIGGEPLADGDRICLSGCGQDANWLTFNGGTLERASGGDAITLPVRAGLLGNLRPLGPERRVHRLSALLCTTNAAEGGRCDPARNDRGQTATSFLFQRGGFGGAGWNVMLLDPGAQMRRADGTAVTPALTKAITLAEGQTQSIALLALRDTQLSELRSFDIRYVIDSPANPRRRFIMALDTPETVQIGDCAQPILRLVSGTGSSIAGAAQINALGSRPGSALRTTPTLPVGNQSLCGNVDNVRHTAAESGGAGEAKLLFSIDRMGMPWLLLMIAAAVALVVHLVSEPIWLRHRLDGQILAILQYLLAVRAIIGIEGVFAQSTLPWRSIYLDVGLAMLTLPMILIAMRRNRTPGASLSALSLIAFTILGAVALSIWIGRPDNTGLLFIILAIGGLALQALLAWSGRSGRQLPIVGKKGLLNRLLDRPPTFWPWLLGAIVGGRVLLGLLYFQERSFGITLSAVYIPLLLIGLAAIMAQAEAEPERRTRLGLFFLIAIGIAVGGVSLLINDTGFALVHVPPIAGIAMWRLMIWWRDEKGAEASHRTRWAILWCAPVAALVTAYLGVWAYVTLTPPPGEQVAAVEVDGNATVGAPRRDATLEAQVEYAIDRERNDPNMLRLRAVFGPSQIDRIGNSRAAVQLDQSLLLQDLTNSLFGAGWLAPVDLGSFRTQATHLSDYLSASHIMHPFGRIGALSLIIVLACGAGAAVGARVAKPADWPQLAGALALWTLFGAAAYMVLANLLLVPFTGRNIYLLAASSGGDLVEGLALLLLARIGLAHRARTNP